MAHGEMQLRLSALVPSLIASVRSQHSLCLEVAKPVSVAAPAFQSRDWDGYVGAAKIEGGGFTGEALSEPGQRDGVAIFVGTAFVERDFMFDERMRGIIVLQYLTSD